MCAYQTRCIVVFLAIAVSCVLTAEPVIAQFQSPTNVTLTMYQLQPDGAISRDPVTNQRIPCTIDDQSFGCTAITGDPNRAYPFNTSTITIGIDGTGGPDNAQYPYPYLWDVVAQEYGLELSSQGDKPFSGVKAQAIASRTYIYQRIAYQDQYGQPDNSAGFHVFLPYRYVGLSGSQQTNIQLATAEQLYLTESNTTYPIDAAYGTDSPAQTTTGTPTLVGPINYLRSVEDPISARYGTRLGNGEGLSSRGASRWSFGHTSSRGAVAVGQAEYPGDSNGDGEFWSVRWDNAEQILTHYYTGIHLRDANGGNAIKSPVNRWVPLRVTWGTSNGRPPTALCAGTLVSVTIWVQNTGVETWSSGESFDFRYREAFGLQSVQAASVDSTSYPTEAVAAGSSYTATLVYVAPQPPVSGVATVAFFEMHKLVNGTYVRFSELEPDKSWPVYSAQIDTIVQCDHQAFLPLIQSTDMVVASE